MPLPVTTKIKPKPWDQQPGESDRAYAAFVVYRDIKPSRSFMKVFHLMDGVSLTTISGWSSRFSWVDRCKAWDKRPKE